MFPKKAAEGIYPHATMEEKRAARARTKNSLEVFYPVAKSN